MENRSGAEQKIADQLRRLRLVKQWSREELAQRCGINVYTLKHFERTGQIALTRLLQICQNLDILDDLMRVFKPRQRVDVGKWEILSTTIRQRGRKRVKHKEAVDP